jgi:hypothetical protein
VDKVRSKDGTTIAFDRLGDGPAVIVVGGETCDRVLTRPLAEKLAQHFTVTRPATVPRGAPMTRQMIERERQTSVT